MPLNGQAELMPEFKFSSLADFLSMSGHGSYVWACVGIAVIVLGFLLWHPLKLKRVALKKLARSLSLQQASPPTRSTTVE